MNFRSFSVFFFTVTLVAGFISYLAVNHEASKDITSVATTRAKPLEDIDKVKVSNAVDLKNINQQSIDSVGPPPPAKTAKPQPSHETYKSSTEKDNSSPKVSEKISHPSSNVETKVESAQNTSPNLKDNNSTRKNTVSKAPSSSPKRPDETVKKTTKAGPTKSSRANISIQQVTDIPKARIWIKQNCPNVKIGTRPGITSLYYPGKNLINLGTGVGAQAMPTILAHEISHHYQWTAYKNDKKKWNDLVNSGKVEIQADHMAYEQVGFRPRKNSYTQTPANAAEKKEARRVLGYKSVACN